MRLSRIWLFVISLTAGVAVLLVLRAPRLAELELESELGLRLERASHSESQVLKINARQWIDTVARLSVDAPLVEALDQANRAGADLTMLHRTVHERLRTFNESMKVGLLWATDARGRVIARIGDEEDAFKDSVEGFPLIADALRGIRSDDSWALRGKLFRVAASPVTTRERYVGTLVVGQDVSSELAHSMKQLLDLDVAFLLDGKVIASSAPLQVLSALPRLAETLVLQTKAEERVKPVRLDVDGKIYLAVARPFAGEAAEQGAAFVVLAPRRPLISMASMARLWGGEHPSQELLWVFGGVLAVFAIGWAIQAFELRALGASRAGTRPTGESSARARIDPIRRPPSSARTPSHPRSTTDEIEDASLPRARQTVAVESADGETSPARRAQVPVSAADHGPSSDYEHPSLLEPLGDPHDSDEGYFDAPTVARDSSDFIDAAGLLGGATSALAFSDGMSPTSIAPPSQSLLAQSRQPSRSDSITEQFRGVFDEFIETKQRCGESTEGLNFEKFADKLRANRAQLLERNPGKNVRFAVYIKDGKAALKASLV